MYTQCPDCLTVFSLEAQALAQARGRMVCGHCQASFDALPRLIDQLPPEPIGRLPSHAPSNELPIVASAVYRPWLASLIDAVPATATPAAPEATPTDAGSGMLPAIAQPVAAGDRRNPDADTDTAPSTIGLGALLHLPPDTAEALAPAQTQRPVEHAADAAATQAEVDPAPDRARVPAASADAAGEDFSQLQFTPAFVRARPRRRRWPWVLLCLVLALLLGGQLVWAERQSLVSSPLTGPWLRALCSQLGCRLPLVQDLHQLRLLARDVQSHPSASGALMISATLRNEAAFAQPYPVIQVTLSDVNGKKLAMRRLQPGDYLDDAAAMRRGIGPGSNVAVVLEVQDPGPGAVAFELGFQ